MRLDITFYDSYSTTEETPSINITNENFYLMFSVYTDSGLPFIDESIYYPKAFFIKGELEKIEVEKCNIDKIGSKYRQLFTQMNLDNHYYFFDFYISIKTKYFITLIFFKDI